MTIIFGVFMGLLLLGVPILFALTGASVVYFIAHDIPPWTVIQRQFSGLNSFIQVAVPLFILAGNLMDAGGSLERIVRFARVTVGRFRGGLAHVNIMASMMFAGVTGSAVADVAALGPLEIQMMTDNGYEKKYATALTCASASVGPIIPPSLPMIMYGVVSGTSVGALLVAGLFPGVIMGLVLMMQVVYYARKYHFPVSERYPFKEAVKSFLPALSAMSIVIIVLGGIYIGFFTPTEAAGFACLVAFILGKFVYKKIKWRDIPGILIRTVRVLGTCSAIFAAASCFSYVIALENVPKLFAEFLLGISINKYVMLLLVNVVVLFVGCFMEGLSIILIITPLILPMLLSLGFDPVHVGVILAVNTTLGLLTPPLGLSLFLASSVTEIPVLAIARKAMPMFVALVLVLLAITFIPQISLFLPNLMLSH
jgi:tripartite ATP-independent transporter DctM subunit